MSTTKGQNLRLFLNTGTGALKPIAAATSCNVELNAQIESSSNKDTDGDWEENECVGKSFNMSADSLIVNEDSEAIGALGVIGIIGETVDVEFNHTNGAKNRTKSGTSLVKGKAIVEKITYTAQNRQNGTCSISLRGTGALS